MIEAAVFVLAAGFSLALGLVIGSKLATKNVLAAVEEDYDVAVVRDLFEELLANPDTSYYARKIIIDHINSRKSFAVGRDVRGKKIVVPITLDEAPKFGDEQFVVDSGVQNIIKAIDEEDRLLAEEHNEFFDDGDPTTEEGCENWVASYESAMESRTVE